MKKGLSLFLCAVVMVLTFCACSVKDNKSLEGKTYVDEQGNTQVYVTDKNGEVVTDANGKGVTTTTAPKTDKNGSTVTNNNPGTPSITVYVTNADGEYVMDKNGKPVTTAIDANAMVQGMAGANLGSTKPTSNKGNKPNGGTNTPATPNSPVDSPKEDLLDKGDKVPNTSLVKTVVQPLLKSGTFTIKGSIKTEGMELPITLACRNGKDTSISVTLTGFEMRMFTNGGKYYMAFPGLGVYSEISKDEYGEFGDMADAFNKDDSKYVQTTKVKDGSQTLTCEEYKSGTGTIKYYFNAKNEWKRMEIIDGDTVIIWNINSFSNTVKDNLFNIHKLWRKKDNILDIFG